MITKLTMRNFKRFEEITIELSENVVLIGPNNSGKTTALQALALWDAGYTQWVSKRGSGASGMKRSGVAVNRKDLISLPVPSAKLLWHDLHVRSVSRPSGKQKTSNVRIDILLEGISQGEMWKCGFEFDYANDESFHCRPLRLQEGKNPPRMEVPALAQRMSMAFLPPMSGLTEREFIKQSGEIGVLLGQGRTAEVLRNLCYKISDQEDKSRWNRLVQHMTDLFGVKLGVPVYRPATSEITMLYSERGKTFDLCCSGRGMQQTLLLLAHLYANPNSVLLLDEPDAHLEILRQRQTYNLISDVARKQNSQIIAASHSEVVLNEAVATQNVVAFVGKPHSLTDRGSQALKSLKDIGFDQYYQAEQQGWVLYVEDSTDLAALQSLAAKLNHKASGYLEQPFVHYAGNLPSKAREHFHGLREGKPDLVGIAIFDRLDTKLDAGPGLAELMWERREIENYFCAENVLMRYAKGDEPTDLFTLAGRKDRIDAMREAIDEVTKALRTLNKPSPWSPDVKASDDVLAPLFKTFSERLQLPLVLRKSSYHQLVQYIEPKDIDDEVKTKLDAVVEVAAKAMPE